MRVEHSGTRGKASFARELNLSPSTYDYYESSRVPPADVLVRIADLTGADLRWLLTGRHAEPPVTATHPAILRAAALLKDHPAAAEPLAAFVELLASSAERFPAKTETVPNEPAVARVAKPSSPAGQPVESASLGVPQALATAPAGPPASAGASPPEPPFGWIPILGRSAAGVPHFWADQPEGDSPAGLTALADLVRRLRPRQARQVVPAEAVGEDAPAGPQAVQLVVLDGPLPPGTAEFVVAEDLARRYPVLFAVRIDGDSMEPEIRHGDVVILSPSRPAEPAKPTVVQLVGQIGVTCKLFRPEADEVHLIPVNERYAPQAFPAKRLVWALKSPRPRPPRLRPWNHLPRGRWQGEGVYHVRTATEASGWHPTPQSNSGLWVRPMPVLLAFPRVWPCGT